MFRKTLSIAAALCMAFSTAAFLPKSAFTSDIAVQADDEIKTYNDFTYFEDYNGKLVIVSYEGDLKNVTIPSSISGKTVYMIAKYAFVDNENIESLTIPNSIEQLSYGSFMGCTNLANIYTSANPNFDFTGGVLYYKFENSTALGVNGKWSPDIKTTKEAVFCAHNRTSVNVPNGVDGIAPYAFYGNDKLENITLPAGITRIGEKAFYGCTKLKTMNTTGIEGSSDINIPYGTILIDKCAFFDCASIHSINFPNTLWGIQDLAFVNCENLHSAYIPDSVEYIGNCAFGFSGTEYSLIRSGSFTLISNTKQSEDGEKTPAAEYAGNNSITIADPEDYGNAEEDEDGNLVYKDNNGYDHTFDSSVTHNPDKPWDHVYIYTAVVTPTCTTPGAIAGICYCGKTYYQEFPATGHILDLVPETVAPTCTQEGYTAYKCTVCGEEVKTATTPATGHTYTDEVIAPTCTEKGYTKHTCTVCGYTSNDSETSALSHNYVGKMTKAATCTATGIMTYTCSVCNDSYTESLPKTDHKYTTKTVAPTYDAKGYTVHTCSVCGDSFKDTYTDKLTKTSIAKAAVMGISDKVYTGKAIKPTPTVKLSGKTLKSGTDYTVSYKNNKAVGKATVTITGKGTYTGTVTKTFKINPKATSISKLTSPKTKQLKAAFKKVSGVTGYQVTYSTSSKFTKSTTKTVTVKATSKTIKSLKKGKTYYVKVRAYKTVSGTKYYSAYSAVKKVKTK